MGTRRDYRASPASPKYGLSGPSYPTPNREDVVVVEDVDLAVHNSDPLDYGNPHPDQPTAILTFMSPVATNGVVTHWRYVFANRRTGQEAYNYSLQYVAESKTHPIYIRSYFVHRDDYVAATRLAPLTAIIRAKLTSGGTGYTSTPAITFTGSGGGTGATAKVTRRRGILVGLTLTNGGSGYAGTITVAITGGGGSGATATASIQATTALLVSEQLAPADPQLGSQFVQVTRVYKTLPGPELESWSQEPGGALKKTIQQEVAYGQKPAAVTGYVMSERIEARSSAEALRIIESLTGPAGAALTAFPDVDVIDYREKPSVKVTTTRRVVVDDSEQPPPKSTYLGDYVWSSTVEPIPGSHRFLLTIVRSELPAPWVEYRTVGFAFPGIFKYAGLYETVTWSNKYPPPWLGDGEANGTYKLIPQRTLPRKARIIYTYSVGKSNRNYAEYRVVTPGAGSRYFNIPNNTVHEAFQWVNYTSGSEDFNGQVVEDVAASTPRTYDPYDVLVAKSDETEWHGGIYEHVLIQVSEYGNPYQFPDVYDYRTFEATELDTITQPGSAQVIQVVSDNAADTTQKITITGWRNTTYVKETLTLNGTTPVSTTKTFTHLSHVRTKTDAAGEITFRGVGTPAQGTIHFLAQVADLHSFTVGLSGGTTYFFKDTPTSPGDVQIGATLADSVANAIAAINLSGTEGVEYAAGTTIHPDVSAALGEEPGLEDGDTPEAATILFTDKVATNYQRSTAWTLICDIPEDLTAFNNGDNGPTFATIPLLNKHAYRAIDFENPDLLTGNVDSARYNLPAFLNCATDEMIIPSPGEVKVRLCASGDVGLACAYLRRTGPDPAPWSEPVALPNLRDGTVHVVTLPGTTTRLKLHFYNGGSDQSRKVHADAGYAVTV